MIEAIYPFISAGFETAAGFICFGRTAGGGKVSAVRRFLFWLCGYGTCWLPVPFLMRSLIFTAVLCLYGVLGKGAERILDDFRKEYAGLFGYEALAVLDSYEYEDFTIARFHEAEGQEAAGLQREGAG